MICQRTQDTKSVNYFYIKLKDVYITYKEQGVSVAQERMQLFDDLPLLQEPVRPDAIACIGTLKATHTMSFADCCITGLAKDKSAILVHKDPEFEQLEEDIEQMKLSYKGSIRNTS
jgi:hypothetical protein